jgi:hypothetical protein
VLRDRAARVLEGSGLGRVEAGDLHSVGALTWVSRRPRWNRAEAHTA